jgi:hypothetical protein
VQVAAVVVLILLALVGQVEVELVTEPLELSTLVLVAVETMIQMLLAQVAQALSLFGTWCKGE